MSPSSSAEMSRRSRSLRNIPIECEQRPFYGDGEYVIGGKSEQRREILISSTCCTIANKKWLAAEVKTQWKNRRIYIEEIEMHYYVK